MTWPSQLGSLKNQWSMWFKRSIASFSTGFWLGFMSQFAIPKDFCRCFLSKLKHLRTDKAICLCLWCTVEESNRIIQNHTIILPYPTRKVASCFDSILQLDSGIWAVNSIGSFQMALHFTGLVRALPWKKPCHLRQIHHLFRSGLN